MQNHARRLTEPRMNLGKVRRIRAPIRDRLGVACELVLEPGPTERHAERIECPGGGECVRCGRDDLDVLVGPRTPARAPLVMAAQTGSLVVDRAQTIAAVAAPVPGDPGPREQFAAEGLGPFWGHGGGRRKGLERGQRRGQDHAEDGDPRHLDASCPTHADSPRNPTKYLRGAQRPTAL